MNDSAAAQPCRSALYVPGDNLRALTKCQSLPADVVILDLEDAVAPDYKAEARERVLELVNAAAFHPREVIVRINGLGTPWHDADLAAVAQSRADGVLVPKIASQTEVLTIATAAENAGAATRFQVWAMLETPIAFLRATEIASATERLTTLVIGTNDLIVDLRGQPQPSRSSIQVALQTAVLAARATGKRILDGVFNAIRDEQGFIGEAEQGRALGFDGKTVIHPSQVTLANQIFGPSPEEITAARTIVSAFDDAQADGKSIAVVDGQMVEALHVREALRTLEMVKTIDRLDAQHS